MVKYSHRKTMKKNRSVRSMMNTITSVGVSANRPPIESMLKVIRPKTSKRRSKKTVGGWDWWPFGKKEQTTNVQTTNVQNPMTQQGTVPVPGPPSATATAPGSATATAPPSAPGQGPGSVPGPSSGGRRKRKRKSSTR